jgi:hypothetical protein
MGSITGSAKAPSQPVQQVIYVPAPDTSSLSTGATTAQPTEEETLQQRAENVLRRSRSQLGTILTGFKGVLEQNNLVAPRKTLLGE